MNNCFSTAICASIVAFGVPAQISFRESSDESFWICSRGKNELWRLPTAFMSDFIGFDDATKCTILFADETDAIIVNPRGKIRGRIPLKGIGGIRTLLVSNGIAIVDEGARTTGLWEYGQNIVEWLRQGRDVRCLDLTRKRTLWKKVELDVGYPVYLGKKELVTLGIDNYWNSLGRGDKPVLSFRLIRRSDGHLLKRSTLVLGDGVSHALQMRLSINTTSLKPTVLQEGNHLVISGLYNEDLAPSPSYLRGLKIQIPFVVK